MGILLTGCSERKEQAPEVKKLVIEKHEKESQVEKEKDTEEKQDKGESDEKESNTEATKPEEKAAANGRTIVLDPGHSAVVAEGTDPLGPGSSEYKAADTSGTSGISTGIPEYQLTLTISQKLKQELENRGYKVLMTRETSDVPRSCTQRAAVANQAMADAFVRIHANGSEDSSAQGAMTICNTPENPYAADLYSKSRLLSDSIINRLCEAAGCENDGVWETDSMSGNNWSQVPVTIVEMGYMTNPQEDENMASEDYQNKIVQGICNGIDEYISTCGDN